MEHVFVVDCVYNRIGMQFIAEGLLGRSQISVFSRICIDGKNRRTRKPEQKIFLKVFDYIEVHIAELRTVALVENNNYLFIENFMPFVFSDKYRKFLNSGNNDFAI